MYRLLTFTLLMIFGQINAQKSLYFSPDLYTKMSFNSNSLDYWKIQQEQDFEHFSIKTSEVGLPRPFRLGGRFGIKLNSYNDIQIGGHWNGTSIKADLFFNSYQVYGDFHEPSTISAKTTTSQSRWFINYAYQINRKSEKLHLKVLVSLSVDRRAGSVQEDLGVGSLGTSGQIDKSGIFYSFSSSGFTTSTKHSFGIGIGFEGDFYSNEKYLCTFGILYSHAPKPLYYKLYSMTIIDQINNTTTPYVFTRYPLSSSLLFSISRRLQILPWKKFQKKKAYNKT